MPNSSASFNLSANSAEAYKDLVGMQPLFKQVPPTLLPSIKATSIPSWAARIAAT